MLYPASWKRINVDQSKVPKKLTVPFFFGHPVYMYVVVTVFMHFETAEMIFYTSVRDNKFNLNYSKDNKYTLKKVPAHTSYFS